MRRNFTMAGSNITGFAWNPATCYKSRFDAAQLHYGGVEYRGLRLVSGNMLQSETLGKTQPYRSQNQRQKKSSLNVRGNRFHAVEKSFGQSSAPERAKLKSACCRLRWNNFTDGRSTTLCGNAL